MRRVLVYFIDRVQHRLTKFDLSISYGRWVWASFLKFPTLLPREPITHENSQGCRKSPKESALSNRSVKTALLPIKFIWRTTGQKHEKWLDTTIIRESITMVAAGRKAGISGVRLESTTNDLMQVPSNCCLLQQWTKKERKKRSITMAWQWVGLPVSP